MIAKRYRVLDSQAKKIGGMLVESDRTVMLTERQARYCLDQQQIVLVEPPPARVVVSDDAAPTPPPRFEVKPRVRGRRA